MKRTCILVAALLLALGSTHASADEVEAPPDGKAFSISIPNGWNRMPDDSKRQTELLKEATWFGGLRVDAAADAYQGPGVVLMVSWIGGLDRLQNATIEARRQLDRVRQEYVEARLEPSMATTELVTWTENLSKGVASGRLVWRHLRNNTTTSTRALLHLDGRGYPRMVQADCMLPDRATPAAKTACQNALASMKMKVSGGSMLKTLPKAGTAAPTPDPGPEPEIPSGTVKPTKSGSIGPADPNTPTGQVLHREPEKKSKRQYLWIGGLLVLALLFWFTTRARSEEAAEDAEAAEAAEEDDAEEDDAEGDDAEEDDAEEDDDNDAPVETKPEKEDS